MLKKLITKLFSEIMPIIVYGIVLGVALFIFLPSGTWDQKIDNKNVSHQIKTNNQK